MDTIALTGFGGKLGDPTVAEVKVDGETRVLVVAPDWHVLWDPVTATEFRAAIRRLAAIYDLRGLSGPVTVHFHLPEEALPLRTSATSAPGEPIIRTEGLSGAPPQGTTPASWRGCSCRRG